MDHIIPYGHHPGDGIIDLFGGTHGDQSHIIIIIHTGTIIEHTIQLVTCIVWNMHIESIDPTEQHLYLCIAGTTEIKWIQRLADI